MDLKVPSGPPLRQTTLAVTNDQWQKAVAGQRSSPRDEPVLSARQMEALTSSHWRSLFGAIATVTIYVMDLVGHILLMVEYFQGSHGGAAAALICLYLLSAVMHIEMDWVNRGRCRYLLADLFQMRMVIEFVAYVMLWRQKRGQKWLRHQFMSTIAFESFFVDMPALAVQLFVISADNQGLNLTTVQIYAISMSAIQAFLLMMHYFKYLHVSTSVYAIMLIKAVVNGALRTLLIALLAQYLYFWSAPCIVFSWLVGHALYFWGVRYAKRHDRDDPLQHWLCHLIFGNQISLICLFVSFPFAPSHCVHDWWLGYLVSDLKMQTENAAMGVAVLVFVWSGGRSAWLFYAVCLFAFSMVVFNAVSLAYLHKFVTKQLKRRDLYTNGLIVRLFGITCYYLKRKLGTVPPSAPATARTPGSVGAPRRIVVEAVGMNKVAPINENADIASPSTKLGTSFKKQTTISQTLPIGVGSKKNWAAGSGAEAKSPNPKRASNGLKATTPAGSNGGPVSQKPAVKSPQNPTRTVGGAGAGDVEMQQQRGSKSGKRTAASGDNNNSMPPAGGEPESDADATRRLSRQPLLPLPAAQAEAAGQARSDGAETTATASRESPPSVAPESNTQIHESLPNALLVTAEAKLPAAVPDTGRERSHSASERGGEEQSELAGLLPTADTGIGMEWSLNEANERQG